MTYWKVFLNLSRLLKHFICRICHDDVQTANTEVQASGFITFRPEEMLTEELSPRNNHNEKKYNLSRQFRRIK